MNFINCRPYLIALSFCVTQLLEVPFLSLNVIGTSTIRKLFSTALCVVNNVTVILSTSSTNSSESLLVKSPIIFSNDYLSIHR